MHILVFICCKIPYVALEVREEVRAGDVLLRIISIQ